MSRCRNDGNAGLTPRLVVSDVDGTLVDKNKTLTPAVIDAVARLRAAGVRFTLISARPMSGVLPIADELALAEPLGAFNGGIVFRLGGEVLSHDRIAADVARGVWAAARDVDVDCWVFADDRWYATTGEGKHAQSERTSAFQEPVVTDDLEPLLSRADKVTFVSDDEPLLRDLHDRIRGWSDRATIGQSQTYYLDVTAPTANKGAGVEALAAAIGVDLADVVVIGDQANDLPMIARAGLSIVVGNAPPHVRAAADHVVASNTQDGVADAIVRVILPLIGATP